MRKLRVAFVAPSLRILGGQAIQADRLLEAWRGDPDVDAWLVPVNPVFPRALRFAAKVKYLRTVINAHRESRGDDPKGIDPARFVFYLQNHDEIGNRPLGERLHHLVEPSVHRAATTLLLTLPQTPLLFMGDEWAASSPFTFFTDHHEKHGARVAEGRTRDFRRFETFASVVAPHPQHPATFEASRLRWDEITQPAHAGTLALHRALLALRHDEAALRTGAAARIEVLDSATLLVRRDAVRGPGIEPGVAHGRALIAVIRLRGAGRVELAGVSALSDLAASRWEVVMHTEQMDFTESDSPMAIDPGREIHFARPGAVMFRA